MSVFKQIGDGKYQVLFPEDNPIVVRRRKVAARHGKKHSDVRFAGTVMRADFYTYRGKKRVKASFWVARTPGCMQLPGKFKTRDLAATPLLEGVVR